MTEEEDIDGLAAEYVLGSLGMAERRQVDVRRRTEASLAAAIAAWERRLGPLNGRGRGVEPPAHALDGVLSHIAAQKAQLPGAPRELPSRRASGRRWAFAAAGSLAACLVLAVAWLDHRPPPQIQAKMDCGKLYKDFWEKRDPQSYARTSPEQLAGISRMVLRAYDACQAGDELDAKALLARLHEQSGGWPRRGTALPG